MSDLSAAAEKTQNRAVRSFGLVAGIGWLIFQLGFAVLLGPHVSLMRSVTLASGIGVFAGLLISGLQWAALQHSFHAGWWVPATTAGCTLGGAAGGAIYY